MEEWTYRNETYRNKLQANNRNSGPIRIVFQFRTSNNAIKEVEYKKTQKQTIHTRIPYVSGKRDEKGKCT